MSDPDAFSVSTQTIIRHWHGGERPLTLDEAQVSIALAAVSGGMFEIGDDLPTRGADAQRLALMKNRDLLELARLGCASTPVDLLDYLPEDKQPSIFLLREDARQSILTVFNWTEKPRTHTLQLALLGLPAHNVRAIDVFTHSSVPVDSQASLHLEESAHSVLVLKIENLAKPLAYPPVSTQPVSQVRSGETITFVAAEAQPFTEPVLSWQWDFGDGVHGKGAKPQHTYTAPGTYRVQVQATFLNGLTSGTSLAEPVSGTIDKAFHPDLKRRFTAPE